MRELTLDTDGKTEKFLISPVVPCSKMIDNMRSALARNLPEATICKPHDMVMSIAGGGPSLADTYQHLEGYICAVNGSLRWLLEHDPIEGARYACGIMDAGEHIADMIEVHPDVRYYVASHCDPSVFDKLDGCDVRLWHVTPNSMEDPEGVEALLDEAYPWQWVAIGGGCTMGLRWIDLGYFLGFRKFKLHGMDSSFRETTHAYPDRADTKQWIEYNGRKTRLNFLCQVYDFAELLDRLWKQDPSIEIEVFGDGLLQDEWKSFKAANPDAFTGKVKKFDTAGIRAQEVLKRLPDEPVTGAEVGVFSGRMSKALLQDSRVELLMVDSWEGDGSAYAEIGEDWHARLPQDKQDEFKAWAVRNTEFAADRRIIIQKRSVDAAQGMHDGWLDFVFIDADHSEAGCRSDLTAWWPKIREGGLIGGHDYAHDLFPGVKLAVDDFVSAHGLTLELGEDYTWFARK